MKIPSSLFVATLDVVGINDSELYQLLMGATPKVC